MASLRSQGEIPDDVPPPLPRELTESGLQRDVKRIQRRSVEGAREREFRPVRPPLAPRTPTG